MPKKSVPESRDLVADARARINTEKEAARELAEAEAIVAEADAKARAKARLAAVSERGDAFDAAVAEYEVERDEALLAVQEYHSKASAAAAKLDAVRAAHVSLNHLLRPQGFLADRAEEPHDRNKPNECLVYLIHGDDSQALRKQLGVKVEGVELDKLRGIVSALPF